MSQAMAVGAGVTGAGEWTLLDEGGASAVTFTSFIDIDLRNEGQALSYPIEEGSFANYNKVDTPLDIRVTLATQGSDSDFEYILAKLDEYKCEAVKLSVSTPSALYESMTLETYSYKRSRDAGAGMLTVELTLIEVREVETQVTTTVITKPKNPTSSGKVNTGKTQTTDVLTDILDRGTHATNPAFTNTRADVQRRSCGPVLHHFDLLAAGTALPRSERGRGRRLPGRGLPEPDQRTSV